MTSVQKIIKTTLDTVPGHAPKFEIRKGEIPEMAEVALLAADQMRRMGNDHSAAILERHVFNDRCDWKAIRGPHKNSQKGLAAAVAQGNLTRERAAELGLTFNL